ncbi:MAG: Crp/Fnr family transcriptional regulator [Alphaproteobacteria bacterium]
MTDFKEQHADGLKRIVREHPFFADLDKGFCDLVCGCAKNVRFDAGQFLLREGETAEDIYMLRAGKVALEIHAPGGPEITFLTLGPGEIVGVSWLVPPYRWTHDARAIEPVRAIALDAACLRGKCDEDHDLGYEMMMRFMPVVVERLQATRLQLLDVYGQHD